MFASLGFLTAMTFAVLQPLPERAPSRLVEGVAVRPPAGFVAFCRERPADCAGGEDVRVAADTATLATLLKVNHDINEAIVPRREPPGRDVWRIDVSEGDCEEYALAKRAELIARGLPSGALRLAVARTPRDERHLVLVVRTQAGDLVLDNLTDRVLPVARTDLTFLAMQWGDRPRAWAAVSL